jgi:hypothetical protein
VGVETRPTVNAADVQANAEVTDAIFTLITPVVVRDRLSPRPAGTSRVETSSLSRATGGLIARVATLMRPCVAHTEQVWLTHICALDATPLFGVVYTP